MSLVNTVAGVLKAKSAFKRNSRRSRFEVNKAKRLQSDALQEEENRVRAFYKKNGLTSVQALCVLVEVCRGN